jgi:hypothetical protein
VTGVVDLAGVQPLPVCENVSEDWNQIAETVA